MNELKVELEWQVTERGLKRITQYLLMIEVVYGLAPNLWKSNAVRDPFLSSTGLAGEVDGRPLYEGRELVRFHWIRRGRVHAVGEYIDSDGSRIWVPFIWFGRHHKRETRSTLEVLFQDLETSPDFLSGEPASPAGVVIVVADRLSGFRVKRDFALGIPTAVVSAEGELIEKMEPGFPSGYFGVPTDGAINLGIPETVSEWAETDPVLGGLRGATSVRTFQSIEDWPGIQIGDLAKGIGQPRRAARVLVERLTRAGIVEPVDKGLYLSDAGRALAARRDRVSPQTVHRSLGAYTKVDGQRSRHMQRHNSGVARLAINFRKHGMVAGPGWRLVINYPGETQIAPDMWVLVPVEHGRGLWHTLEYELSAQAESSIERKLRPYRTAQLLGEPWPLLMVCGTREAAEKFGKMGNDLPMLVSTAEAGLKGAFYGAESVWKVGAKRWPLTI